MRCLKGTRICKFTGNCVKISKGTKKRCPKGERKCPNGQCYTFDRKRTSSSRFFTPRSRSRSRGSRRIRRRSSGYSNDF